MGAGQSTSGGRPSPRSNPHIRERGDGREASFGLVGNFWEDDEVRPAAPPPAACHPLLLPSLTQPVWGRRATATTAC